MFKLHVLLFALLSVYARAELQLLVPPDNLSLISTSGSKSVQTASAAPALNIDQPEDQSDDISTSNDADGASASADDDDDAPAPASVKRTSLSQSGASSASSRSALLLQRQILPAASLPLPITIATRPGLRTILAPETITIHRPAVAKIGEVVQRVPTAVSHQSQTIVHNHANIRTPIVAPAVRSVTQHVVRAIHQPLILSPKTRLINL